MSSYQTTRTTSPSSGLASSATTRVAFFTARYCLVADLTTGTHRLSEVLNNRLQSHLTLDQVQVTHLDRPDQVVGQYTRSLLSKAVIRCAIAVAEPSRSSQQRLAAYVPKTRIAVCVLLPDLQVVGSAHLTGKVDPVQSVLEGTDPFLLLADAWVTVAHSATEPMTAPIALVNRAHMEMVSLAL
jgi:hypothetical protein